METPKHGSSQEADRLGESRSLQDPSNLQRSIDSDYALLSVKRLSTSTTHRARNQAASAFTTHRNFVGVSSSLFPVSTRAFRLVKACPNESWTSDPAAANGKGGFTKAISNNATYKVRSHNTHYKIHVPEIRSRLSAVKTENATEDKTTLCVALLGSSSLERFKITGEYLRTVLLGDSMFERFKTTGELHLSVHPIRIHCCSFPLRWVFDLMLKIPHVHQL